MHPPRQPDLIQRHLMTMSWNLMASPDYLKRMGVPERAEDLDQHRLLVFGDHRAPVPDINWVLDAGRRQGITRRPVLEINSIYGLLLAVKSGLGIAAIPNYMVEETQGLVRVLPDIKAPKVEAYFVYPEELRNSKRVSVFRDFLLAQLAERG
jgi:DNA-binding transcriptional LysR family regulator